MWVLSAPEFLVNKEWKMMLQVSNLSGLDATTNARESALPLPPISYHSKPMIEDNLKAGYERIMWLEIKKAPEGASLLA